VITITFTPWAPFHARKDKAKIRRWMQDISDASVEAFRAGASRQWPGGDAKGSAPGEWPMRRTGGLRGSIRGEVTGDSVTIGTSQRYSIFLRMGTRTMGGRRKMSDNALEEGRRKAKLGRWVEWSRGSL
jgi:hypothetical protein